MKDWVKKHWIEMVLAATGVVVGHLVVALDEERTARRDGDVEQGLRINKLESEVQNLTFYLSNQASEEQKAKLKFLTVPQGIIVATEVD